MYSRLSDLPSLGSLKWLTFSRRVISFRLLVGSAYPILSIDSRAKPRRLRRARFQSPTCSSRVQEQPRGAHVLEDVGRYEGYGEVGCFVTRYTLEIDLTLVLSRRRWNMCKNKGSTQDSSGILRKEITRTTYKSAIIASRLYAVSYR